MARTLRECKGRGKMVEKGKESEGKRVQAAQGYPVEVDDSNLVL